jgi:hypothetical protein
MQRPLDPGPLFLAATSHLKGTRAAPKKSSRKTSPELRECDTLPLMTNVWAKRFELIRGFGWLALGGLFLALIAAFTTDEVRRITLIFAILLSLPAFIYTYVVTIWHWKDRYRGNHSDLWSALILIETSGWMKFVYLFRHLIPDMRHTGRYKESHDPLRRLHANPQRNH